MSVPATAQLGHPASSSAALQKLVLALATVVEQQKYKVPAELSSAIAAVVAGVKPAEQQEPTPGSDLKAARQELNEAHHAFGKVQAKVLKHKQNVARLKEQLATEEASYFDASQATEPARLRLERATQALSQLGEDAAQGGNGSNGRAAGQSDPAHDRSLANGGAEDTEGVGS